MLTVWLRRQDQEIYKLRALMSSSGEHASKAFMEYYDKVFPFAHTARTENEKKMVQAMKKEVAKGAISFSAISMDSPLNKAVQRMHLPDEFKEKLRERKKARG